MTDDSGVPPRAGQHDVTAPGAPVGAGSGAAGGGQAAASPAASGGDQAGGYRVLGTLPGTLMETLGIEVLEAGEERVVATMPVTRAHHQPYGLLHGGASVALAETVASIGATLLPFGGFRRAVGLEINANHVRSVREGSVTAVATPLHKGRSTQVWSIEIRDEAERLVCIARCTVAVLAPGPE